MYHWASGTSTPVVCNFHTSSVAFTLPAAGTVIRPSCLAAGGICSVGQSAAVIILFAKSPRMPPSSTIVRFSDVHDRSTL